MKKALLPLALLALTLVGCKGTDDKDVATTKLPSGTGTALNPTGKPLSPEDQKNADLRNQAGQAAGANMARAAEQMKEAQAKSGGK